MGAYKITFTETRDAVVEVQAPTVEHARERAKHLVKDWMFPDGEGYNRWISDEERVDSFDDR